jgi:hypothetical protein
MACAYAEEAGSRAAIAATAQMRSADADNFRDDLVEPNAMDFLVSLESLLKAAGEADAGAAC